MANPPTNTSSVFSVNWDAEPDPQQLRRAYEKLSTHPVHAVHELEVLSAHGSLMSKRYLARAYSSGLLPDPDSKLEELWYRRAADQGSIQAKYDLGTLCREQKRYSEALELFESCAADGFAPSMNALAYMNFEGEGTNRNQKRAEELWKRAISLGNLLSKRNYGWRLVKGSYGIAGITRGILLLITMRFQYPKLRRLNRFDERLI